MTGATPVDARTVAECCFLDVGQGTCSIILLGDHRAIVVDCGPRSFTPVRALSYFGVREIVALMISHNDVDHYGGAAQVVQSFPKQIQRVYFLEDRPTRRTPLLALVRREVDSGNLRTEPIRLEATSPSGSLLHEDLERHLSLHVLFPSMPANIDAREGGGCNRTGTVLALQCGMRRIVFGGDLPMEGWRQVWAGLGGPISCDVLAVPHHGGALVGADADDEDYRWLYGEALRCDAAVVSVGTNNQPKHPSAQHLAAIRHTGASIMCTQITQRCCAEPEQLRPGVVPPQLPGASSVTESRSRSGRSRHVACAGSVLVEIGPMRVGISRLDEHAAAVDALASADGGHPLCRPLVAKARIG